jgi:hypothetical protein
MFLYNFLLLSLGAQNPKDDTICETSVTKLNRDGVRGYSIVSLIITQLLSIDHWFPDELILACGLNSWVIAGVSYHLTRRKKDYEIDCD